MKIVIAPDSFKGSMSSEEVIEIISEEAKKIFDNPKLIGVPIADGGEGTVDALVYACDGATESIMVSNPLGETITAQYGKLTKQKKSSNGDGCMLRLNTVK